MNHSYKLEQKSVCFLFEKKTASFGTTYSCSALFVANVASAVSNGDPVAWDSSASGTFLRLVSLVNTNTGIQVSKPGTYLLEVMFIQGPQHDTMSFYIAKNGTQVGLMASAAENAEAMLTLSTTDVVSVVNASGVSVTPQAGAGKSWLCLTPV